MLVKLNFNSLETVRKINMLAEICYSGIQWNRDLPEDEAEYSDYITGGVETVAHIVACCIVQWFGFESCGTADTAEFLKMETAVSKKKEISIKEWEIRIAEYLKKGVDCQEN